MEIVTFGFIVGYLLSVVFIGIGYIVGVNMRIRESEEAEDTPNDELADALDAMKETGICPSRTERVYLTEAAERLRRKGTENE